jgi:hypothetical protein
MAKYRSCIKWKKTKAALLKLAHERARKSAATGHPAAPKTQQAKHSAEQMDLGEGWNHVVRAGCVFKAIPIHTIKTLPSAGHGGDRAT